METPIIHVDMDAFFASVEIRDNPELKGKPVIIGGDPRKDVRGVVSTACYEARKFGVHSAMPLVQALRLCPQGVFLRGSMNRYAQVSKQVMEIFSRYTPLVEAISIDEAFLDVRGCDRLFGSPRQIALSIQRDILGELGLTCSVGVAPNKFLAKLASDLEKPQGLTIITPDKVNDILNPLPIEKLWGVGEKTALKLRNMGIDTIGQLAKLPQPLLVSAFGKLGAGLWHLARGEDVRVVETQRQVKSISRETTFPRDLYDLDLLHATVLDLAEDVSRQLREKHFLAGKVTLKIRFGNFETLTRQATLAAPTCITKPLYTSALDLLAKIKIQGRGIRLVGVGAGNLVEGGEYRQISFFIDGEVVKEEKLASTMDKISARYGSGTLTRASLIKKIMDDKSSRQ